MPPTPSLLRLLGQGFEADEYAADGIHLRWLFDPALGFPWFPWCLERRPSLGTKAGRAGAEVHHAALTDLPSGPVEIDRGSVRLTRQGQQVAFGSVALLAPALPAVDATFESHASPAAWASVTVRLQGASHVTLEAYQLVDGEERLVDRATASFRPGLGDLVARPPGLAVGPAAPSGGRGPRGRSGPPTPGGLRPDLGRPRHVVLGERRLRALLAAPARADGPPRTATRQLQAVHELLVSHDAQAFTNVTPDFLAAVAAAVGPVVPDVGGLVAFLPQTRSVQLEVFGDHIDLVRLTGHRAVPLRLSWVEAEMLRELEWEPIGCVSAITDQPTYHDINEAFLPDNLDVAGGTEQRLGTRLPNGAEPMDDPQVPPSRPPTLAERMARYGQPWIDRLEPWLDQVLTETEPGGLHQSEVTIEAALTEFGQQLGDGIPDLPDIPDIAQQIQTIEPYGFLLAASMAFPNAQLLGLATIDEPPPDHGLWDYRLTGWWRVEDLAAYVGMLHRRTQEAQAVLASASPADLTARVAELAASLSELLTGIVLVQSLAAGAVNGLVRLTAYVGGLSIGNRARFAAPTSLAASFEALGTTGDPLTGSRRSSRSTSHLEWPMPVRRQQLETDMAFLATIARREQGTSQPFSDVLNPVDPDVGVPGGVVPSDEVADDDGVATADFFDLDVVSGEAYTYGVTHADPFGRWSSFAEVDHAWTYDLPPNPVHGVQAELAEVGEPPALRLTTEFRWPIDLHPPEHHEFSLFVRRDPVSPDVRHDPAQWTPHGFSRTAGAASPLRFAAGFTGALTHDGMQVEVQATDETQPDPSGATRSYRRFVVHATGIQLNRVDELARCWVAVRSHDVTSGVDGEEMAGPDLADHWLPTPPPPPAWPPDPLDASIADADGLSTFDLSWAPSGSATYEVFRVAERDLVAHLAAEGVSTAGYDPDAGDNFRAAALKALAVDPASRRAFARRSELAPGVGEHRDRLPGHVSRLYVYVVLSRSVSGVASPWPTGTDRFLAVRVPRAPLPARPVVARARWEPAVAPGAPLGSGDRVELQIVEPPPDTAAVVAYEVYRTASQDRADTTATMRLLHRLDSPVFSPGGNDTSVATYIDPHVDPWRTYTYRVVARAPGSVGGVGMRSDPSAPVRLTTLGTSGVAAPVVTSVTPGPGMLVTLSFTAELPSTPVGDSTVELLSLGPDGHHQQHARVSATTARTGPGTYDVAGALDGSLLPAGAELVVRVTDPAGSSADALGVAPPAP